MEMRTHPIAAVTQGVRVSSGAVWGEGVPYLHGLTFVTFRTNLRHFFRRYIVRYVVAFLLIGCLLVSNSAYAGPPYLTDDPAPTQTGHWEIYAFGAGTQSDGGFDGVAGFDQIGRAHV